MNLFTKTLIAALSILSVALSAPSSNIVAGKFDADFHFVGDYFGTMQVDGRCKRVGLQVNALGDGKFTGMFYLGGVPGNGWNKQDRDSVSGIRAGNILNLTTKKSGLTMTLADVFGQISDSENKNIGCLRKHIRTSCTLGLRPHRRAVVLFDGTDTDQFQHGKISEEGYLQVGTQTVNTYRDFYLHLEYRLPYLPKNRGQNRANSGVYINSRYEVQILDSFGLEGRPNECGGLYRFKAADQNMVFPPLAWQTYDIRFRSPGFNEEGKKIRNARITVRHNGITIHNHVELPNKTGAGRKESPQRLPIKLQAHGSPVHYRNIWLIDYEKWCRR